MEDHQVTIAATERNVRGASRPVHREHRPTSKLGSGWSLTTRVRLTVEKWKMKMLQHLRHGATGT